MTRKLIIASRNDGFGTRMLGFLNARYLADAYGQDFGFLWPQLDEGKGFHGVPGPEAVFAEEYVRKYLVQGIDADDLPTIDRENAPANTVRDLLASNDRIGVTAHIRAGRAARVGAPPPDCPRLWHSIQWSARMRTVLDAARESIPDGAVGVHMRRGDIVYGTSRFRMYQKKYVPLALCRRTIAAALAEDRPVALFCDDPGVVESFRSHFPKLLIGEALAPEGYSRFERDVFELAALAQCARIVGRASGFATLAALIGGVKQEDFAIPRSEVRALVLNDIASFPADYPPLGEAKDLLWTAIEAADKMSVSELDQLLERAAKRDPQNVASSCLRAALMAREQRPDLAESIVVDMLKLEGEFPGPVDLASSAGKAMLEFPAPQAASHPHLAAFSLLQHRERHSPDQRLAMLDTCQRASPRSVALAAAYIDELSEQGMLRDAVNRLSAAFAAGHSSPRLHARMSRFALGVGDFDATIQHGQRALEAGLNDEGIRLDIAGAMLAKKQVDDARSLAGAIDPLGLNDPTDIARLVRLLRDVDNAPRAEFVARSWADRPLSAADPRATPAPHSHLKRTALSELVRGVRKLVKRLLSR